jgi:D-lactate dehydrogenase
MKMLVFDTHRFEREFLRDAARARGIELTFVEPRLTGQTASLATGHDAVCSFVNDRVDRDAIEQLKKIGVRLIALRSAGFNHVDLAAAREFGIRVVRVPEYSPYAVAEHAVTLVLSLNRKIHRALARTRELNFSLEGLVGFDLHGKTVGIIGTGRIGRVAARIFRGFGCRVLAFDAAPDADFAAEIGLQYVDFETVLKSSDILSLHVPLTPTTHHLIDGKAFASMKPTALIVNTGRGALIETKSLIKALKAHRIGGAALDVYEEEEGVFFQDLSEQGLGDDQLARLLTFPNVVITSHQAFLTEEALKNISETTMENVSDFENGRPLKNEVEKQQGDQSSEKSRSQREASH